MHEKLNAQIQKANEKVTKYAARVLATHKALSEINLGWILDVAEEVEVCSYSDEIQITIDYEVRKALITRILESVDPWNKEYYVFHKYEPGYLLADTWATEVDDIKIKLTSNRPAIEGERLTETCVVKTSTTTIEPGIRTSMSVVCEL